RCKCGIDAIEKYRTKVSGPLMDRIDLHIDVPALPTGTLSDPDWQPDPVEHESAMCEVVDARSVMLARSGKLNAYLSGREIEACAPLEKEARAMLEKAIQSLGLSARGYYKILKVARTIADLSGGGPVTMTALSEAIGYRRLDRYQTSRA
ncbi:MAG: ATP-binding protein, partial [Pseudomonadales bacterium]|nr:ATP-binding protein [Pseudomonadales bacterium]